MKNTIINYKGVNYRPISKAVATEAHVPYGPDYCWEALAIKDDARPDEYGNIPVYIIRWYMLEYTNWENPDSVELEGGRSYPW